MKVPNMRHATTTDRRYYAKLNAPNCSGEYKQRPAVRVSAAHYSVSIQEIREPVLDRSVRAFEKAANLHRSYSMWCNEKNARFAGRF